MLGPLLLRVRAGSTVLGLPCLRARACALLALLRLRDRAGATRGVLRLQVRALQFVYNVYDQDVTPYYKLVNELDLRRCLRMETETMQEDGLSQDLMHPFRSGMVMQTA